MKKKIIFRNCDHFDKSMTVYHLRMTVFYRETKTKNQTLSDGSTAYNVVLRENSKILSQEIRYVCMLTFSVLLYLVIDVYYNSCTHKIYHALRVFFYFLVVQIRKQKVIIDVLYLLG